MPAYSHNGVPRDNKNNLVWVRPDGPDGVHLQTQKNPSLNYTAKAMREIAEVENYIIMRDTTPEEERLLEEINNLQREIITEGPFHTDSFLEVDMDDMDNFEDQCNMKEAYHALLAKSPQGKGTYLCESSLSSLAPWEWTFDFCHEARARQSKSGLVEVDDKNRIMTPVEVTTKGTNYIQGNSEYGKVYFDLKFTKYVPDIGEKVNCVIGLNGGGSMPWKCYRIPQ
jgi:hypothetical protein